MSSVESLKIVENLFKSAEQVYDLSGTAFDRCEHNDQNELVASFLVDAQKAVTSFEETLHDKSSDDLLNSIDDLLASVDIAEMLNADLQKVAFYIKIGLIANKLKEGHTGNWAETKQAICQKIKRKESALEKYMLIAKFEDALTYFRFGIDGLYALGCISKLLRKCFTNHIGFRKIKLILEEYDFIIDNDGLVLSKRDFKEKLILKICSDKKIELVKDYFIKLVIDSKDYDKIISQLNNGDIPDGHDEVFRKIDSIAVETLKQNVLSLKIAAKSISIETDEENNCAKDTIQYLENTIEIIKDKLK